jgi:hypothetical protein
MEGLHFAAGSWSAMLHGFVTAAHNRDPEPRGQSELFSTSMVMFQAARPLGKGPFGFRFMGSMEPTMGRSGYPLLLQTGETADGTLPLVDRQHPHDLFMEIAATYSLPLSGESSLYFYFAPVGEPALGPPAFMHRASAVDNPIAPITHHWLDSTHITFGVFTVGFVGGNKMKLEGSIFTGREPNQNRWGLESPTFDSYSGRVTVNPTKDLSIQLSLAELNEPEILHQGLDIVRVTASAIYNRSLTDGNWQTTVAWGQNKRDAFFTPLQAVGQQAPTTTHIHYSGTGTVTPSVVQHAFLAESALTVRSRHTFFSRFEMAQKDELFSPFDRRHGVVFDVSKLTGGYVLDLVNAPHVAIGLGGSASIHWLPDDLVFVYGETPSSYNFFARFKLK